MGNIAKFVSAFVPNTKLVDVISTKIVLQLVGLERINFIWQTYVH